MMLTEQDKTNIQNGAKEVWSAIGHDIFEALELEKELDPHADKRAVQTITKKDVVELVLDAGRLDGHLKEQNQWKSGMENLSLNEWVKLVEPAFTFDVYGK
tara:strand:- start:181 stop:483 length:303 start_codon:yes stop_codon:yes gene_type:complete